MKLTLACCTAAVLGIGGLGAVRSGATPESDPAQEISSSGECRVVSAECVGGACILTCESADGRTCRVEIECPGCPECCGESCEASCER